jgi:hypothetical protein
MNRIRYHGTRMPLDPWNRKMVLLDEMNHCDLLIRILTDEWEGTDADDALLDGLILRQSELRLALAEIDCQGA